MTTKLSIDEIKNKLEEIGNKDINIKINYKIDSTIDFLDVAITNDNGHLITTIFHKPAAEPYILPYTSDHPRHVHRNIPYGALLRAARLCSNVHDFNLERIRIDMSLLLNNYSPKFISAHFHRFFQVNNAISVLKELDEDVYQRLHQNLLYQPTRRENNLKDMTKDPVQFPVVLQTKTWNRTVMYPRYTFESGPISGFPTAFYKWWHKYYTYSGSPLNRIQVQLVANTNRTLENFFIYKKPPRELLRRMDSTMT